MAFDDIFGDDDVDSSRAAEELVARYVSSYVDPVHDVRNEVWNDPWIIPGILPSGVSVLYGPTESFKSFLALDMAMSVAYGRPWQGRFPIRQGRHVLYISAEGDIEKRMIAWQLHHGLREPPSNLVVVKKGFLITQDSRL